MKSAVCEDVEFSLNHTIQKEGKNDKDQELFEALAISKHDQWSFNRTFPNMKNMKNVVFVPVKDDINSTKDDWYVLSGVTNPGGGAILEQKKYAIGLNRSWQKPCA